MDNSGKKPVPAESSGGTQNNGITRQNRSKASDGSEKVRFPQDLVTDGQLAARKSGIFLSQRRGSRKQTLSLNPEEREALENLIEEVILDGMGDGVVDSDGSSSDNDEDKTDDIFENECGTTSDGSIASSSLKMNKHENASLSGTVAGKKYYPGQLKVALKHMSNLPPRFVRKLAKAQQYLDASSTITDEPVRQAVIVGRIEEEEELGSATHIKDDSNSPVSGQSDKDKSKLKETKLQEAKKQIRSLLCDRDQYVDEQSLTAGALIPGNIEAVTTAVQATSYQSSIVPVEVSVDSVGKRHKVGKGISLMIDSVATAAAASNIAPSQAASLLAMEAIIPSNIHVSKVQAYSVAPSLSANVPDFVPKHCTSLPMVYSSSTGLGTPFNRANEFASMSPAHSDNFARTVSASVGSCDPQYYMQQTPVQGHPTSYYGMPHMYSTPPPAVGISSRIIGDVLPASATLVQPVSVNGLPLNNSGSYGLPSQYSLPAYNNVYSSPYLPHPPQSLQTNMYLPSYNGAHNKPPVAYQMPGSVAGAFGIASSGNSSGVGGEFQYSMEQSSPVKFSGGTASYASFNSSPQRLHQHGWVSTSQSPGLVEFPHKSQAGQGKWSNSSSPVSRTSLSQTGRQTVRFAHSPGTPANRMTSSKIVPVSHSSTGKSMGTVPYSFSYALPGSNWLQGAFSNTKTSERDIVEQFERHPVSTDCLHSDSADFLLPAKDSNPLAGTPVKPVFNSKYKRTNAVDSSGTTAEDSFHSNISSSSSSMSDISNYRVEDLGHATEVLKAFQEKSLSFTTSYPENAVFSQSDPQQAVVQRMLVSQFKAEFSTPVPILDIKSDHLTSSKGGDVSDSLLDYPVILLESKTSSDVLAPATAKKAMTNVVVPVCTSNRISVKSEAKLSSFPKSTVDVTNLVFVEGDEVFDLHADHLCMPYVMEPSHTTQKNTVLGNEVGIVSVKEFSSVPSTVQTKQLKDKMATHACDRAAQVDVLGVEVDAYPYRTSSDKVIETNRMDSAIAMMEETGRHGIPDISLGSSHNMSDIADSFQSSLQVPETLSVTLSSDFLECLMNMFKPENTHESPKGANSPASLQVILNSEVLRQIYISWKESHDGN